MSASTTAPIGTPCRDGKVAEPCDANELAGIRAAFRLYDSTDMIPRLVATVDGSAGGRTPPVGGVSVDGDLVAAVDGWGAMSRVHLVAARSAASSSTSSVRAVCGRWDNHWLTAPGAVTLARDEGTVDGNCRQCFKKRAPWPHLVATIEALTEEGQR